MGPGPAASRDGRTRERTGPSLVHPRPPPTMQRAQASSRRRSSRWTLARARRLRTRDQGSGVRRGERRRRWSGGRRRLHRANEQDRRGRAGVKGGAHTEVAKEVLDGRRLGGGHGRRGGAVRGRGLDARRLHRHRPRRRRRRRLALDLPVFVVPAQVVVRLVDEGLQVVGVAALRWSLRALREAGEHLRHVDRVAAAVLVLEQLDLGHGPVAHGHTLRRTEVGLGRVPGLRGARRAPTDLASMRVSLVSALAVAADEDLILHADILEAHALLVPAVGADLVGSQSPNGIQSLVRIRSHLERSAQVWEPRGGLRGPAATQSAQRVSHRCGTTAAGKVSRQTYWRGGGSANPGFGVLHARPHHTAERGASRGSGGKTRPKRPHHRFHNNNNRKPD